MGFWADLFGFNKWCTVDELPFDIKYYLTVAGFFEFVKQNVDRIIWDRGLKKFDGLALINLPFPPKKIKIRGYDQDYINEFCYGRFDILAVHYSYIVVHEASHFHEFIRTGKTNEDYPTYMQNKFLYLLSLRLKGKPFVLKYPGECGSFYSIHPNKKIMHWHTNYMLNKWRKERR